ncbi:MAG: leucine-rich repeat protein [Clostridia bacterium]|nr:leucine-rich repeat protein [Clostridia bacterium]
MSVVKESAIDYNGGKYVGPTQNPYLIIVDTTASTGDFVIHNDTKLVYDSAVMYNNFSSITIPNGVVYISEYGFAYSYKVTNIQIPNTVEYIGYSAFSGCELFTVTFESGSKLKRIESHAFYLNPLTSIVIPEGVEYIGESCFYYCEDLTEITIPSTLKYARRIFGSYGSDNSLGRVNISNLDAFMVNHIGLAFTACSYDLYLNGLLVTEIVIPEGVTRLDDGELTGCKSVTKVTLPNSIEYIGGALNTSMLSNYTVYNNLKYIGNSENEYLYLIGVSNTGQTTYTIHESTKIIRGSTFNSCNNLTSLTIPKSVTFIGSYLLPAFNEVDLRFEENSNLKYLDNYSLYYGIIQTVVISKNVQYIGNGAIEQAFTSDGKVSFETIIFEDGSNIEYGEIEPIRLKEAVRTIVFESLSFVNGTKIKKDLKCLFETLLSGSVVKVKCSSVSAVKLSILTNKYKFTASYDSATGYAIFTKI